jgi:hypothetical protein
MEAASGQPQFHIETEDEFKARITLKYMVCASPFVVIGLFCLGYLIHLILQPIIRRIMEYWHKNRLFNNKSATKTLDSFK